MLRALSSEGKPGAAQGRWSGRGRGRRSRRSRRRAGVPPIRRWASARWRCRAWRWPCPGGAVVAVAARVAVAAASPSRAPSVAEARSVADGHEAVVGDAAATRPERDDHARSLRFDHVFLPVVSPCGLGGPVSRVSCDVRISPRRLRLERHDRSPRSQAKKRRTRGCSSSRPMS